MIESGSLICMARRLILSICAIALVVVLGWAGPARGTIINVPADQPNIQAGIEAAVDGDTVLVAPGHYYENVDFRSKEIVVSSHFMLDRDPHHIFNTIIDGSQPDYSDSAGCVRIFCSSTQSPVLQGFSLTGGTGTYYMNPEGQRCNRGGGVATDGGSPVIRYNYIHDNISNSSFPMGGGGICLQRGTPVVTNNIIVHNTGLFGCGITTSRSSPVFRNNVIAYNSGGLSYGGGGIYQWIGNGIYENNTVVYNESTQPGGGIKVFQASAIICNSIIWGNQAPSGEQLYSPSSTVTVEYCDVEGSDTGTGNINADPMFVGDWFLTPVSSPGIDAGNPGPEFNDPPWPSLADSARWPSQGGLTNDMGAWGGPDRFPFELIAIYASPAVGWVPTEVNFWAESYYDAESWAWNFGDGSEATGETPANMYNDPGL
ncbi:MAG: right-handed parallel beta-helix repeat-containing protein, partial [candidate division Zixibacteria bacterium]|nr:right-handed parallel beta-helix repeat-containing protein [candidate division Zixibacteria bacterium]